MRSVYAVVDLEAIRQNARRLKKFAGVPLIAVVKDDAYGHGAEVVSLAIEREVDAFAVATTEEGAALRAAGITKHILVLSPPLDREEVFRIIGYSLTASVGSRRHADLLKGTNARVHLAVNTGMNRYGVRADQTGALLRSCLRAGLNVTGMYSHLYAATDARARAEQLERFRLAEGTVHACIPNAVCHLSATDGTLAGVRFDAVRVGLGLYGYASFPHRIKLVPAMKLYATVVDVRRQYGDGAGYQRYSSQKQLYTLRVGYGQGFFREGGIGVGKLCMDACIAEGRAKVGERKQIIADPEIYAAEHDTSVYEVLVRIGKGVEKLYVHTS